MIRSTDITQLPAPMNTSTTGKEPTPMVAPTATTSGAMPPGFLNEPHRDMIMQKQRAADNFSLPQSSTLIQDDDDDPAVHEAAAQSVGTYGGSGTAGSAASARANREMDAKAGALKRAAPNTTTPQTLRPQLEEDGEGDQFQVDYDAAPLEEEEAYADERTAEENEDEDDGQMLRRRRGKPYGAGSGDGKRREEENGRRRRANVPTMTMPPLATSRAGLWEGLRVLLLIVVFYVAAAYVPVEALIETHVRPLAEYPYVPLIVRGLLVALLVFLGNVVWDKYGWWRRTSKTPVDPRRGTTEDWRGASGRHRAPATEAATSRRGSPARPRPVGQRPHPSDDVYSERRNQAEGYADDYGEQTLPEEDDESEEVDRLNGYADEDGQE